MWFENRERTPLRPYRMSLESAGPTLTPLSCAGFAREVNCSLFDEGHVLEEEDGSYSVCMVTYLLYASPFIIFGVTLFFSIFLLILARHACAQSCPNADGLKMRTLNVRAGI